MVDVSISVQTYNIKVNVTLKAVIPVVNQQLIEFEDDNDVFEIKDRDGFVVFRVDANGNVYQRGSIMKV